MQLKCNRFVFDYQSAPEEVENYILRSADMAEQTYGRDVYFARLNQIIIQARFLGWQLPNFGSRVPEEFSEIPPEGIDHIFENQAKLLVDVAPATRVLLENGSWCPVRMVCGTTPAGDLIWKTHLLSDSEGCPYVQNADKRYLVKTKGTRLVCQTDQLSYDENYMMACFGGKSGYWPMPFLPEVFVDRPIAYTFRPEDGVVEVVRIAEEKPVRVLAKRLVPWYQRIELDRTKALTMEEYFPTEGFAPPPHAHPDLNALVSGWDDLGENEQFELDDSGYARQSYDEGPDEQDLGLLVNLVTHFSKSDDAAYLGAQKEVEATGITSRAEADSFKDDPRNKEKASRWVVSNTTKQRLLYSHANKLGAILFLLKKHQGQKLLLVQPNAKYAKDLEALLKQQGKRVELFDPRKAARQLKAFFDGKLEILVTEAPDPNQIAEGVVVISVTATRPIRWLELCDISNIVYTLPTEQLNYTDHNLIPEHEDFAVEIESYQGKSFIPAPPTTDKKPEQPKTKPKEKKEKFKIKTGKGRPKTVASYDKAMELVKKQEAAGKRCEIYSTESSEALYITGIGELN